MKKILVMSVGLILVLMLSITFVSAGIFGDLWGKITGKGKITGHFTGGSGTILDPYQIRNCVDLQNMTFDLSANYTLMKNIDCDVAPFNTSAGFNPVGNNINLFTGSFDGEDFTITGLFIYRPGVYFVGLFGETSSSSAISNVGLVDVDITGQNWVGGLVGSNNGDISNSYSTGRVDSGSRTGGLVGRSTGDISNSYSTSRVIGNWRAGGLVGRNTGDISNSYSNGNVTGNQQVGGLAGLNEGDISNSYSTGSVIGNIVGGLIGDNTGTCTDSFWDNETSGQSNDNCLSGSTGLPTLQMKTQSTFTNWDFTNIWDIDEGNDYPRFQGEVCTSGDTRTCGVSTGECVQGTQTCDINGVWSNCGGSYVPPATEICDGKDNNCVNGIDEVSEVDDEINPNKQGGSDQCATNWAFVNEFWCEPGGFLNNSLEACLQGKKCFDGECVSCYDSDDGLNYTIQGTTWNNSYNIGLGETDFCDGNNLTEYFCDGPLNIGYIEEYDCSQYDPLANYVCQDGACVCISDWVISNEGACQLDETQTVNLEDINGCEFPRQETRYCDSNNNGIIGDDGCLPGIDILIEGFEINASVNYTDTTGTQSIELWEQDATAGFDWDFSSVLNLCPVEIEISNSNNDFGYIIIKNLTADVDNKTVWFDRLNNSNQVCIRDLPGVVSVNEFSGNCNVTGEVLVSCPGTANVSNYIYNCDLVNNGTQFKVWPLQHSAVMEWFIGAVVQGCVENWDWGNWSNMTEQCGTRTGQDLGGCENYPNNTKTENQTCGQLCVPSWTHSGWGECIDGFKYKTYSDINGCGSLEGKPDDETWECEYGKSITLIIIVIVGIILLILGMVYFIKKKKQQALEGASVPPSSPATPPSQTYAPQVQPVPRLPIQPAR